MQDARCIEIRRRFAERVRRLRRKQGLSQERLADLAKVHRVYMGRIERGAVSPTICVLDRLAKALNSSMARIVQGIDKDNAA